MAGELLKKVGRLLPAALRDEWADKRAPEWVPQRALAQWRCPKNHKYEMSRFVREQALMGGVEACPRCRAAVKLAPMSTLPRIPAVQAPAAATGKSGKAPASARAPKAPAAPASAPQGGPVSFSRCVRCGQQCPTLRVKLSGCEKCGGMLFEDIVVVKPPAQTINQVIDFSASATVRGDFLVRDLRGMPLRVLSWEWVSTTDRREGSGPSKTKHHIMVLDRSGSMWSDMDQMRDTVRKVLGLEEYSRPDLLVSVISYSSGGQVRRHVERCQIASRTFDNLADMRAEGLTCMSDGLSAAFTMVRAQEQTVVSLHSDGYCNDPSPGAERVKCASLVQSLRSLGAVVNTVAYRGSSDFQFLAQLANAGGGACVQAGNLREVYDALCRGQQAAAGDGGKALVSVPDGVEHVLRVHRALRRVLLVTNDFDSIEAERDEEVYLVRSQSYDDKACRERLALQRDVPDAAVGPMLALARGLVGAGRVTEAKQVALSTGVTKFLDHARALTGPQVAALASSLDALLFADPLAAAGQWPGRRPFLPQPEPAVTLPELLAVVGRHPGGLKVYLPALMQGYKRRGLKRVPGKWVNGKVESPQVFAAKRRGGTGSDGWCDLISVSQSDSEATVNITVAEPIELMQTVHTGTPQTLSTAQRLTEVAGVSLESLRQFRSFTVVGDGEVTLSTLPCRIVSKELHAALDKIGADFGHKYGARHLFSPGTPADLSLDLPLLRASGVPACPSEADVLRVFRLTVLQRILSASLKDGSASRYSPEQVAALRAVHVTVGGEHLNFSPPTCYPYESVKAAQAAGQVDARVRYRVTFGGAGVLNADDLPSANEHLQRRWYVGRHAAGAAGGEMVEKPTMIDFFSSDASIVREKTVQETKRLKLGAVDELVQPLFLFTDRMRQSDNWANNAEIATYGLPQEFGTGKWDGAENRKRALRFVEDALEAARGRLREVVMHVGASGSAPTEWGAALDADAVEKLGYKVGKIERDGQFYHVGGVIVGMFATESLFSVSYESSSDSNPA